jgi:fumarylpyruvate hydrolase
MSGALLWDVERPTIEIVGSDLAFPVRRVYCVGRNYVEHIREMKEGDERDAPFFFQKPSDSIVTTGNVVPYPSMTDDFQFEGELVAAIGRGGTDIPMDRALDHLYGYAVGIDLTRRDRQREAFATGKPWEIGKSFDHSAPCGPITPVADAPSLSRSVLTLTVNDETRQTAALDLMIWNVAEIVSNLSRQYRLERGDLIYTGTPAGVGPIVSGDTMHVSVPGLANLEVTVR